MTGSLFDAYKAALRRGHLAALDGRLEDALEAYRAAAALVPERALPLASQGTVLHRLDRWAEAAAAFDAALGLAADDEATLRARAVAREERQLTSGAAADYERLAFVLDVAGRAAEAAEAAARAATLEPTTARAALAERLATSAARLADFGASEGPSASLAVPETVSRDEPSAAAPAGDGGRAGGAMDPATDGTGTAGGGAGAAPTGPGTPGDGAGATDAAALDAAEGEGRSWPAIDLPSPPPPPIVGPPPDPETLLAQAEELLEAGQPDRAGDLLLTAVMIHRNAGRLDAALDLCLQLLAIAPGDPHVHLAIANLQLDRGWSALAVEKLDLLRRLTALTGDTQAEADVHALAAERVRDEGAGTAVGSR